MKWIKANERLPDSKDCSTGIIVKYKGHKYRAYFHQDNNQFDVTYVNVTLTFGKGNYGGIEWLDETPQLEGDGWNEGMPDYDGDYLCSVIEEENCGVNYIRIKVIQNLFNNWVVKHNQKVTHWQPLPKSPIK